MIATLKPRPFEDSLCKKRPTNIGEMRHRAVKVYPNGRVVQVSR